MRDIFICAFKKWKLLGFQDNKSNKVLKPEEVEAAVAEAKSQGKSFRLDLD